jgi:hypothetical protein
MQESHGEPEVHPGREFDSSSEEGRGSLMSLDEEVGDIRAEDMPMVESEGEQLSDPLTGMDLEETEVVAGSALALLLLDDSHLVEKDHGDSEDEGGVLVVPADLEVTRAGLDVDGNCLPDPTQEPEATIGLTKLGQLMTVDSDWGAESFV